MESGREHLDWTPLHDGEAPPQGVVLDVIVDLDGFLARHTHARCRLDSSTGILEWFDLHTDRPLSVQALFPTIASAGIWHAPGLRVTHWRRCRCGRV